MGTVDLPKSGKTARPQTARLQARSAPLPGTGENRREPQPSPHGVEPEVRGSPSNETLERIFREQSAMFSNRLGAKLPGEAMPGLDEKLYNFISRNFRSISGSFPLRHKELIRCDSMGVNNTAIEMMLERSGDQFNKGEIEKSNRQWGIDDLEAHTNNMLRRKTGVGSVVDSQKANSVVTCVFKDNAKKPKTVTDLRLAVNIPETELIDPESRFKAGASYLVREIICKHLHENIYNTENNDSGDFLDRLLNQQLEIDSAALEKHLQNIDRNVEIEGIREKGFSAASNLIVSILNAVNLDCQFLKNIKEKREFLIREYEDADEESLPDEHYQIRLRYFSKAQLSEEREKYDKCIRILGGETQRLWDLLEVIYQDSKSVFKVNDFGDLARKNKSRVNDLAKNGGIPYDPQKPVEAPMDVVRGEKEKIRVLLARMEERIKNISDSMYPVERQISEERLTMLKNEFSCFENDIDPYNLQPGILVDINLSSIKRKRTTLDSMAAALGRFLNNVATCFHDMN
jgi:hypothetical protein